MHLNFPTEIKTEKTKDTTSNTGRNMLQEFHFMEFCSTFFFLREFVWFAGRLSRMFTDRFYRSGTSKFWKVVRESEKGHCLCALFARFVWTHVKQFRRSGLKSLTAWPHFCIVHAENRLIRAQYTFVLRYRIVAYCGIVNGTVPI